MTSFLISWISTTANKKKGRPKDELTALFDGLKVSGEALAYWPLTHWKSAKRGDRAFLLRKGPQGHGIIGYGEIDQVQRSKTGSAKIRFIALTDPRSSTVLATQKELHAISSLKRAWLTRPGGTALPPDIASQLERLVIGRTPVQDSPQTISGVNPDWTSDELIVALDFYLTHRPNIPSQRSDEIAALSGTLNRLGQKLFFQSDRFDSFRNANGVYMKLMNFLRLDPTYTSDGRLGLRRGAHNDKAVWDEFASDPTNCNRVARAIVASVDDPDVPVATLADDSDEGIEEAAEGKLLTKKHISRERNRKLVISKRARVFKEKGKLACEACGFDFSARYGKRGSGFIECHHTKPVASLIPGDKTHLRDLALVCSNCHRMIHRTKPWMSIVELQAILRE